MNLIRALLVFTAAIAAAQVRDTLPIPDIPGYKTLKCDFHMHSVFSDGDVWPTVRVSEAFRDGFDAIALTDHADYRPHKDDLRPDAARPIEIARRMGNQVGIIVVPGIEISRDLTHMNALFVTDAAALVGIPLPDALRRAAEQKAFVFWNHPGWRKPKAEWTQEIDAYFEQKLFHGMELLNGGNFYPDAYPWVEQKRLTIFANSDVHGLSLPGRVRPVTLVFARSRDMEGIREALLARRTAAWMNGQVWGAAEQLAPLWNGGVQVERGDIRIKAGERQCGFWLRNSSALPFEFRLRAKPAWITGGSGSIKPEGTAGVTLNVSKEAPVGQNRVELAFEVTNFHTGPDSNLTVTVPVTITVEP